MSTVEVVLLAVAACWLAGLSFVLVLLTRQLGLLQAWAVEQTASPSDGLEVGAEVPRGLGAVLPDRAGPAYLLFLGGNCQPCREFALEARDSAKLDGLRKRYPMVAAVTGTETQVADLAGLLPPWFTKVDGKAASDLMKGFEVIQTPSIFELEGDKVTGRAVAGYGLTNFLNLIDAREASDAGRYAGTARGTVVDLELTSQSGSGSR